ncbi:hypothetical protein GCM10022261_05350 [Brevibacterium daeguense]|uniref:Uncharacterized protein n=1 Tax=Brevibacterium daeguense TaxID=909936 RepID=A0ABP8EGB1_9MICO|nr:hypothetical protein [Brevibacterium daeguense]
MDATSDTSKSGSARSSASARKAGKQLTIDRAFVEEYAPRYPISDLEDRVLRKDGPRALKKGVMKRKAFLRIGQWKGLAALSRLEQHPAEDVEFITSLAVSRKTPDKFRVSLLRVLDGVGVPLASSVLSAVFPTRFAIMDARATDALHAAGHLDSGNPARADYAHYISTMRTLAEDCGCSLVDLYRALYAWAKDR